MYISVRSIWSKVSFTPIFVLLIFCLDALLITESEVLKSPTTIALLSIFSSRFVNNCFIYLVLYYWVHVFFQLLYLLMIWHQGLGCSILVLRKQSGISLCSSIS